MKRRTRVVLASLGVVIALLGAALAFVPELRTFAMLQIAPARARDALLVRLRRRETGADILLLGTIHGAHLTTPAYSLGHLEAVLRRERPARLLVESRPEELAAGNLADGPIEMAHAHLLARALGIEVAGIDWVSPALTGARRTDAERDDHMVANLLERCAPSGTTLVLVGYAHVPEFVARLQARGFSEQPMTRLRKTALFDVAGLSPQFPSGLGAAITRRIARDEARLADEPDPGMADRLRDAIAARRAFLQVIQAAGERAAAAP